MAGTIDGGKHAASTNKSKYGGDFYKIIGKIGGSRKARKGFALMPKARVSELGRIGGQISRRGVGRSESD